MLDEGKYAPLWAKYAAVIHVLLKKTDTENQKFQLYKHEFENKATKQVVNLSFSFDLINGRAVNLKSTTTIARDLWLVLDRRPATRLMLKERKIKISFARNFELLMERIIVEGEVVPAKVASVEVPEEIITENVTEEVVSEIISDEDITETVTDEVDSEIVVA